MTQRSQLFGKTLFVDLMMSTLVVITSLLMASNAIEKSKKKLEESNIRTDGEYAIVVEWPDDSHDDVDMYVRDPNGKIAYFASRDVGLMHLEHDDQGAASDGQRQGGGGPAVLRNEERVVLRGIIPGEFTVNVHLYNQRGPSPTMVTVTLYRLKGEDTEVLTVDCDLLAKGDEMTAFRFTLNPDGTLAGTSDLQRQLMGNTPRGRAGY